MSQTVVSSRWVQDLGIDHPRLPCCPHVVVSIGRKDEWTRKELKNQRTTTGDMLWSTPADSSGISQAWRCLGIIPGILIQLVARSNLSAADLMSFLVLIILEA